MKKLIQFTIILLWAVSLFAQTPEKFSYQSVIRNANEELLTNTQLEFMGTRPNNLLKLNNLTLFKQANI